MDYLTSSTKALYRKYLIASLGSALVITIYSFVDTIAVGQSEGPAGTAAMAVISPVFGILVFLGILFGIGGSVLMNNAKGEGNKEKGNAYFTMALLLMIGFTVLTWVLFAVCSNPILCFFGANEGSLPVVMRYAKWLIRFWPVFPFSVFLGAFVRNDNAPGLVMAGVISGGCFNVFGDWFFVFPLGMGMEGAAIATVLGTTLQCLIICSHLFRKRCRLKLAKPFRMGKAIRKIFVIGIGASLLDLGHGGSVHHHKQPDPALWQCGGTGHLRRHDHHCGTGAGYVLRCGTGHTTAGVCQFRRKARRTGQAVFKDVCGDRAPHGCPVHAPCGMSACAHYEAVYGRHARGFDRCAQ